MSSNPLRTYNPPAFRVGVVLAGAARIIAARGIVRPCTIAGLAPRCPPPGLALYEGDEPTGLPVCVYCALAEARAAYLAVAAGALTPADLTDALTIAQELAEEGGVLADPPPAREHAAEGLQVLARLAFRQALPHAIRVGRVLTPTSTGEVPA